MSSNPFFITARRPFTFHEISLIDSPFQARSDARACRPQSRRARYPQSHQYSASAQCDMYEILQIGACHLLAYVLYLKRSETHRASVCVLLMQALAHLPVHYLPTAGAAYLTFYLAAPHFPRPAANDQTRMFYTSACAFNGAAALAAPTMLVTLREQRRRYNTITKCQIVSRCVIIGSSD